MEKKYLIMNCTNCYGFDQYIHRKPITLTDNYNKYIQEHRKEYDEFEVYELTDKGFILLEDTDETAETGMAFYYWTNEEMESDITCQPHIIRKWRHSTRNNVIPNLVITSIQKGHTDYDNSLVNCGYISWHRTNGNYFVYGEYRNNYYKTGF